MVASYKVDFASRKPCKYVKIIYKIGLQTIDTRGIDYANVAFLDSNGNGRILIVWN